MFTLAAKGLQNSAVLEIYNTMGQLVHKQAVVNEHTALDLSAQPNGIYLLYLRQNGATLYNSKVLKK
jgi:hypothetical protein